MQYLLRKSCWKISYVWYIGRKQLINYPWGHKCNTCRELTNWHQVWPTLQNGLDFLLRWSFAIQDLVFQFLVSDVTNECDKDPQTLPQMGQLSRVIILTDSPSTFLCLGVPHCFCTSLNCLWWWLLKRWWVWYMIIFLRMLWGCPWDIFHSFSGNCSLWGTWSRVLVSGV